MMMDEVGGWVAGWLDGWAAGCGMVLGSRKAFMILQVINQSNNDIVLHNSPPWLRECVRGRAVNESTTEQVLQL